MITLIKFEHMIYEYSFLHTRTIKDITEMFYNVNQMKKIEPFVFSINQQGHSQRKPHNYIEKFLTKSTCFIDFSCICPGII